MFPWLKKMYSERTLKIVFDTRSSDTIGHNYLRIQYLNKTWQRPWLCSYSDNLVCGMCLTPCLCMTEGWWRFRRTQYQNHTMHHSKPGVGKLGAWGQIWPFLCLWIILLEHHPTPALRNCVRLFFALQWQRLVVTEMTWPLKPKLFCTWTFTEKVYWRML